MDLRRHEKRKNLGAFTLIEVTFVIAIITILLSILLPGMNAIRQSAQKLKDVSNLKKIAEAWQEAVINRDWSIETTTALNFMRELAGYGKNSTEDIILNDPSVYLSPGDKYASKPSPTSQFITVFDDTDKVLIMGPPFLTRVTNPMINDSYFISYCLMCNHLSKDVPLATTPLAFTRGLNKNGLWDQKVGLYGNKGGYVVYCDGHVVWFDGSKPARFLKWDKSGYTSDIRQAVPTKTIIICSASQANTSAAYKVEDAPAFVLAFGTGGDI
jgi:type II secretory pathway pseudopilin PulG